MENIFSYTAGPGKGVRWPKEGSCFCWSGISDFFQTHPPTERFPVVKTCMLSGASVTFLVWKVFLRLVSGFSILYSLYLLLRLQQRSGCGRQLGVCEKKPFVSLQLWPRQLTAVKWVCRKLSDNNLFTLGLLSRKNPVDENTATFSGGYYIFCKNAFLCFQESHSWLFFYYYFFLKSFLVDRSRFKCTCGSVVEVNLESERFTAVRSRCR